MGLFNRKQKKEENTVAPGSDVALTPPTPEAAPAPDFSSQLGEQQPAGANQITELTPTPAPAPEP